MERSILIQGDGLAACCSAYLLQENQSRVIHESMGRALLPAVLASGSTQRLVADVFGDQDLFRGFHRIRRRIVRWGASPTVDLPHEAVVVPERDLLDRLWSRCTVDHTPAQPEWSIRCGSSDMLHFGSRRATITRVDLQPGADEEACWVESVEGGWLFLLPLGGGVASLIQVGLAAGSTLIQPLIGAAAAEPTAFRAYPRIQPTLCGPGWLACGSGAMAFDPVCGEGAGNAVREAILASAVIRCTYDGQPVPDLLAHYSSRLLAGFLRHLETCRQFYAAAEMGPWWSTELSLLDEGLNWTRTALGQLPRARYRLIDFDLSPA